MKRIIYFLLIIIIMTSSLVGCNKKPKQEENKDTEKIRTNVSRALEDLKEPLTLMNERMSLFEKALDATKAYLSDTNQSNLNEAKKACGNALGNIPNLITPESKLDELTKTEMIQIGIDPKAYKTFFSFDSYFKSENVQALTIIYYYLTNAPKMNENLKYVTNASYNYYISDRKLQYICLNGVFCKFDTPELEKFKNTFLKNLKTLSADKIEWIKDTEQISKNATAEYDGMTPELDKYKAFIQKQGKIYKEMQGKYFDILVNAGFENDTAIDTAQILAEMIKGNIPNK